MSYRQVSRECEYMQQVSTVRTLKCHNDTLHSNQRHREEEPHNIDSNWTPDRQQKKSNPLSLPLQDDCNILGQNNWWFKVKRRRKQQQWRIPLKIPSIHVRLSFIFPLILVGLAWGLKQILRKNDCNMPNVCDFQTG